MKKYLVDFPNLLKEWHPSKNKFLNPMKLPSGSEKKVWWKCPVADDHEWEASIYNRTIGRGCPYCSGKKVSLSNSLESFYPELIKEWHPTKNGNLTPSDFVSGSEKKVWWKCSVAYDHEWETSIYNRTKKGNRCPFCANRKVSVSNSLAIKFPGVAKYWHPTKNCEFIPRDITAGSSKKFWWKCPVGDDHEWEARVEHRVKGVGCPFCANKKVSITNSLTTKYPELAREFHPSRNGIFNPENVLGGGYKVYWWKCNENDDHEWEASLNSRIESFKRDNKKKKCPHCTESKEIWIGEEGLERAKNGVVKYFRIHNRSPSKKDLRKISYYSDNKLWEKFGVKNWNDLLELCDIRPLTRRGIWMGEEGLNRAKKEILDFYIKYNKSPARKKVSGGIFSAITGKKWSEFGINTWNDLLKSCDLEINVEHRIWQGKKGFQRAQEEIISYFEKHKRIPINDEIGFKSISTIAQKGFWIKFGIKSWNDLIKSCNLEVAFEWGKWKGIEGLIKAEEEINRFYIKQGKVPIKADFSGLADAAQTGKWSTFGINTWNDLLRYFSYKPNYEPNIWTGKKGLEKAKYEILEFYNKNNRSPFSREVTNTITSTISRGFWKEYHVKSWNDLLTYCGVDINVDWGKWKGKEGLKRAQTEIVNFVDLNGKTPRKEDGFQSITSASQRDWNKFGINSWNDLLRSCFVKLNSEPGIWKGKEGLERAKEEILEQYDKFGKTPTQEHVSGGIPIAIRRGEWIDYGIKSWNEILLSVGLDPNVQSFGLWSGDNGLVRAQEEIMNFFYEKGDPPKIDELKWFTQTISKRGFWPELGINSWNDLLTSCGLELNFEPGKWKGNKGLERAKKEILSKNKTIGRTPSSRDLPQIQSVANKGIWEKFGINSWTSLLKSCNLIPNPGIFGEAPKMWELWCEKALNYLYPSTISVQKRLPNNSIPDFQIDISVNFRIIIDAKLSSNAYSINEDIRNYQKYCDRLEFWCMFGSDAVKIVNGDEIFILNSKSLIQMIKDKELESELRIEQFKIKKELLKEKKDIPASKTNKIKSLIDYL